MMRLFEAFRTLLCMCNRVVYTRTYVRTYSVTYPTVMSDITHDKGCVSVWSKAAYCTHLVFDSVLPILTFPVCVN